MIRKSELKNALVTTDLHLTDNSRDNYRWMIFDYLMDLCKEKSPDRVLILGDLTDAKDNHSAEFLNKIVDVMIRLSKFVQVEILKGNHDYRTGKAFFQFLNCLPNIRFVSDIEKGAYRSDELWLPHTREPVEDWKRIDFSKYSCIFMHETAKGSVVSNGFKMKEGISANIGARNDSLALSGDIHVPQRIGQIIYPGSPYHVHFGDRFEPRLLHFDSDGRMESISTSFPQRFTANVEDIADLENLDLQKEDMIKVRVPTKTGDLSSFRSLRQEILDYCKDMGVEVAGMEIVNKVKRKPLRLKGGESNESTTTDARELVKRFGQKEGLEKALIDTGISLVEEHDQKEI